jgi:hypothetical protein
VTLSYHTLSRVYPRQRLRQPWRRPPRTLYLGSSASAAPSDLIATAVGEDEIGLSWSDNTDDETGQELQYSTSDTFVGATSVDLPADDEAYAVTGLDPETTYYFRVRAVTPLGFSDWSNTAEATTDAAEEPEPEPEPSDTHGGTATGWTRGLRFPREPESDWVEQLRQLEAIDDEETALLLILANL